MEGRNLIDRLCRLKAKNGSVLFVVVVMMSIMIILATSVYYIVSSSRGNVVMVYSGEQANETALNVLDLLGNAMVYQSSGGSQYEALYNKISSLKPEDGSIFTKVSRDDMPGGVGDDVDIEIYAVDNGNGGYDIVMKSSVEYNGKTVTASKTLTTTDIAGNDFVPGTPGTDPIPPIYGRAGFGGFTRLFATTGYQPQNTRFTTPGVTSEVYFGVNASSETVIGYYRSSEAQYYGDVLVLGNLYANGAQFLCFADDAPHELNVSGNLILEDPSKGIAGTMKIVNGLSATQRGIVRVGGDLVSFNDAGDRFGEGTKPVDIYVCGNLVLNGNMILSTGSRLFVGGTVSGSGSTTGGTVYRGRTAWDAAATGGGCETFDVAKRNAFEKTQNEDYPIISLAAPTSNKVLDWGKTVDSSDWSGTNRIASNGDNFSAGENYVIYIDRSCTITDVKATGATSDTWNTTNGTTRCVIIDTGFGNSPTDPPIIIKLKAQVKSNEFWWRPAGAINNVTTARFSVMVIGDGAVFFDIPDDIEYNMGLYDSVLPYNMAVAPGQRCWTNNTRLSGWGNFQSPSQAGFLNAISDDMKLRTDLKQWTGEGSYVATNVNLNTTLQSFSQTVGNLTQSDITNKGYTIKGGEYGGISNNIFFIINGTGSVNFADGSFTAAFLYAINTRYAITSVGQNNISFFGGMIVASLEIANMQCYMGVQPDNAAFLNLINSNIEGEEILLVPGVPGTPGTDAIEATEAKKVFKAVLTGR